MPCGRFGRACAPFTPPPLGPALSWRLKVFFSIFSSGGHLVYWSGMILVILVGSHLHIPVRFESHWPKSS